MSTAYEVTYIVKPSLEDTDVEACIERISKQLTDLGGEVKQVEPMGRRRLAYEINDVREGYYVTMTFASDVAPMKELERQLKLNEDIMRSLFIKLEQ